MALQRGKLADIQSVGTSAASVLANPAATKTYVRGLILHNTAAANVTVELNNVPDNSGAVGTAATANRFFKGTLSPDDTLFLDLPYPIVLTDTNDSIHAKGSAAGATIQLLGDKDS